MFGPMVRGRIDHCKKMAIVETKRSWLALMIQPMSQCQVCTGWQHYLMRWLLGTHQGSVKPHQMDAYLDEFAFRFNRRSSRSRGLLFYRLLEQAVVTEPVTYGQIVGGTKHRK